MTLYVLTLVLDLIDGWDMCVRLKQNGLIAKQTHENIIRLSPPLVINEDETDEAVDIIVKSFEELS